jgi:N-acetylmuramoyl-L-alanine amidase
LLLSLRTRSVVPQTPGVQRPTREVVRDLAEERRKWKLDVIVIDPGHGGRDPGALGVTGTKEKDISLGVALRLGRHIEKNMPGVNVVYTRKTDRFVELYRRTQIANEAGGKLFVSLHCNSLDRKPSRPNGFEIYLLRPGKTEDAIAIAAKENAVIQFEEGYKDRYKKLTEEEFIIITMAQSAYMKYSEHFAETASVSMASHLRIRNSGVKQAGFYVLVGASMPNVLVELGYISNKNEEQLLKSSKGQDRLAEALFKGIQEYRTVYEKALEN